MNNRINRDYQTAYSRTERFLMGLGAWTLAFVAVLILDYFGSLGA